MADIHETARDTPGTNRDTLGQIRTLPDTKKPEAGVPASGSDLVPEGSQIWVSW